MKVDVKPQIEYKYIPRTFEEEQNHPEYVTDIFSAMFSEDTPWIKSIYEYDYKKKELLNKFFISQA